MKLQRLDTLAEPWKELQRMRKGLSMLWSGIVIIEDSKKKLFGDEEGTI